MHAFRFHLAAIPPPGAATPLPREEGHHAAHVLRLGPGDEISVFDGRGSEATARIADIRGEEVRVEVLEIRTAPPPAPPRVHLLVPWLKQPTRLEWLIEKAAELGAAELTVFAKPERQITRRLKRWRRLAVAAAKQSGAAWLMETGAEPGDLASLTGLPLPRVLLSEKPGTPPLRDQLGNETPEHLALAVGPEQGFTPDEEQALADRGWELASLGPRRLRTETAALAALAAARSMYD